MPEIDTIVSPPPTSGAVETASPAAAPSLQDQILTRIAGDQPAAAKIIEQMKSAAPAAPADPAAPTAPEVPAVASDEKPDAGNAEDPLEVGTEVATPEEEIQPEDDAATQLRKLNKAQQKLLKRIDKVTAENKELKERQTEWLEDREKEQRNATPEARAVLPHLKSPEEVNQFEGQVRAYLGKLRQHAGSGFTEVNADGDEIEISPPEVAERIAQWSGVLVDSIPQRRTFLDQQIEAQKTTETQFAPWKEKPAFKTQLAELDRRMAGVRNLMADYDQARHERALGRLVLEGGYTLMPKAKATETPAKPGDAVPATARSIPPPPSNAPTTSGPPLSPAGQGPDLADLRAKMLANPTNRDLADAYIKATLKAARTAA